MPTSNYSIENISLGIEKDVNNFKLRTQRSISLLASYSNNQKSINGIDQQEITSCMNDFIPIVEELLKVKSVIKEVRFDDMKKDWTPRLSKGGQWKFLYDFIQADFVGRWDDFINSIQEDIDMITLYLLHDKPMNRVNLEYLVKVLIKVRTEFQIQQFGNPEFIYNPDDE